MQKVPEKHKLLQGGFVMLTSPSLPEEAKPQGRSQTQDPHKGGYCAHHRPIPSAHGFYLCMEIQRP